MLRSPPERLELGKEPRPDQYACQTEAHGQSSDYSGRYPPARDVEMLTIEVKVGILKVHVPGKSAFAGTVVIHTAELCCVEVLVRGYRPGVGFESFRRLTAVKVMKIKEILDSRLTKWQRDFL